jgi:predicted flap endonuclease-1-like 5' DNA nuclease
LLSVVALVGSVVGWLARGRQAAALQSGMRSEAAAQQSAWYAEQLQLTARNRGLIERLDACRASETDAANRAREFSAVLKEAFERRDDLQCQVAESHSELADAALARQRLQSELMRQRDRENQHADALGERDRVIFRLSRELEGWQERLPPLIQRFRERDDDATRLQSALDQANERILELEAGRLAALRGVDGRALLETIQRVGNGAGDCEGEDDLQAIKGVGPAIERTLHALGIYSYSQVAGMSEYDINRIAERLRGFRSRIYREDWVGQARDLQHRRGRRTH